MSIQALLKIESASEMKVSCLLLCAVGAQAIPNRQTLCVVRANDNTDIAHGALCSTDAVHVLAVVVLLGDDKKVLRIDTASVVTFMRHLVCACVPKIRMTVLPPRPHCDNVVGIHSTPFASRLTGLQHWVWGRLTANASLRDDAVTDTHSALVHDTVKVILKEHITVLPEELVDSLTLHR